MQINKPKSPLKIEPVPADDLEYGGIFPAQPAPAPEVEGEENLSVEDLFKLERQKLLEARIKLLRQKTREVEASVAATALIETETLVRAGEQEENAGRPVDAIPTPAAEPRTVAKAKKARRKGLGTLLSALLFVGVPVLLSTVYFCFVASNQYASTAQFAVRSNSPATLNSTGGLSSLLNGGGGVSLASLGDMFIVQDYIQSPQILQDLKPSLDLRKIYGKPTADWLARLNPKISDEELLNYWHSMVNVQIDNTTGLGELTVRAFSAGEAKTIADQVLLLSENLVNKLSERSKADTTRLAENEVDEAYDRVLQSLDALQSFAESSQQVDPHALAKSDSDIQARLDTDFVNYKTQLDFLRKNLPEDAPSIQQLQTRITAVATQLVQQKAQATSSADGSESAAAILSKFDKLSLQREFAEKAYLSSLASLESARLEARAKTRYLEPFVRPHLADYPEYPERLKDIFLTALVALLSWVLGGLVVSAAREHL